MPDRLSRPMMSTCAAALLGVAGMLQLPAGTAVADDRAAAAGSAEAAARQPAPLAELNAALAAARAKLEELSKAAEIAARAADLRDQVQTLQQDKQRLAAALQQAEAARDAAARRAEEASDELRLNQAAIAERRAREAELAQQAEQSAADLARVREQLAATEGQLADANAAQEQAARRVDELRTTLEQTRADAAEAKEALARTREAVATARSARVEAEQERDGARQEIEGLKATVAGLEKELAGAEANAVELRTDKARIEEELALLQDAASSATEIARQNLVAMEEEVRLLHGALDHARKPASSEGADGAKPLPTASRAVPAVEAERPGAAEGSRRPPPVKPAAVQPAEPAALSGAALGADLANLKARDAARTNNGSSTITDRTAGLPLEIRLQVQSLLADLDARTDARGVLLTVPGETLFEAGADEIGAAAHDTLAKIAEVIGIYDGREVLITGHTDALGEPVYNRMLSERRADLIRTFFVDNFGIDSKRLRTRGFGEQRPLASNATGAGRQANRRVEVLILDEPPH